MNKFSIFLKLIILIIIFIVLVNLSIGFIIRFSLEGDPFRTPGRLTNVLNDYLIKDIGNPPDTVKARSVLNELQLKMRYETDASKWASSPDILTLEELKKLEEFKTDVDKFKMRNKRKLYDIVKVKDGYIIFEPLPPGPREDINEEKAILALVVVFTILAFLLYFSLRWIFGPIKKLSEGVRQISQGDFDSSIDINRKDELGSLADAINEMKVNISNMIKSKQSLLIDVSHELRSPLTRIKLANEFIEDEKIKNRIRDDVKEMETMITGLLETYRMDSSHEKLNIERTDIVELVKKVISKFSGAEINFKSESEKRYADFDREKIEIVIRNLLDNAVKYSNGFPVNVKIYKNPNDDNETFVSVKDKGKGIEKDEIKNIFEPFYRIDKSRDKKIRGYGLGLSIVRKILDLHNSTIEVKSKSDEGTEFIINFKKR